MKRRIMKGSKLIFSEAYCPASKVLELRLMNHDGQPGNVYQYKDVSMETYRAFTGAASAGKFFLQHIKPKHECEKVSDGKNQTPQNNETEAPAEAPADPPSS